MIGKKHATKATLGTLTGYKALAYLPLLLPARCRQNERVAQQVIAAGTTAELESLTSLPERQAKIQSPERSPHL